MSDSEFSDPESGFQRVLAPILAIAISFVGFLILIGLLYIVYYLLTIPMRRNERARMTLDLLELGFRDGRTPELALIWAGSSGDRALGKKFRRLVWCLERGQRLSEALRHVPRLLPPQVNAVLRAGERLGDIPKVLPACRHMLRDGVSQTRGALNYVILLTMVFTPAAFLIPFWFQVSLMPKLGEIFGGLSAGPLPAPLALGLHPLTGLFQGCLTLFLWLAVLTYIGGPRLRGWLRAISPEAVDWLLWQMPWRRNRLQRDFSALFAVLLDAGVPEGDAVFMAAEATNNVRVLSRAKQVQTLLASGVKLPEAVRALDDSGEFRWRLSNALQQSGGFLRALNGWHGALDARAFQLEQTAAQVATTLLVIFNGLVVAMIFIGMFIALIRIIDSPGLW